MCGIVGLLLREPAWEARLGELVAPMLEAMSDRGPDSTGIAFYGQDLEVVKDVGPAPTVVGRHHLQDRTGYLAVGHTRMATESAVTVAHCHPFVAAGQVCLVHNGSFSNHNTVRRRLEAAGTTFDSDNDSEVAARYVSRRMEGGDGLETALESVGDTFDGFYTLLVAKPDEMAVARDRFACKPVVAAETPQYVAVASEYRALATLPGIERAHVSEPAPAEVHVWSR